MMDDNAKRFSDLLWKFVINRRNNTIASITESDIAEISSLCEEFFLFESLEIKDTKIIMYEIRLAGRPKALGVIEFFGTEAKEDFVDAEIDRGRETKFENNAEFYILVGFNSEGRFIMKDVDDRDHATELHYETS